MIKNDTQRRCGIFGSSVICVLDGEKKDTKGTEKTQRTQRKKKTLREMG
jgi:hypothetical protein